MKEDKHLNSTDSGFELDKIDPAKLKKPADIFVAKPKPNIPPRMQPAHKSNVPVAPKTVPVKTKLVLAAVCILVVIIMALLLSIGKKYDVPLPFYKTDKFSKPQTYISVGPVLASVKSGDMIKMTLDINCAKKKYHSKIKDMDSKIRNRMVWALQTPKAEQFLDSGDFVSLRAYLSASVMEILPPDAATEIYISEFLRY